MENLNSYLIVSAILFSIGTIGVLTRKNAIVIFMCVELMLNAVNLTFVALSRHLGNLDGQANVWIAIIFQSDASGSLPEGAYVDDLLLQQCTGGACAVGSAPARPSRLHGVAASLVRPANVRPVTR